MWSAMGGKGYPLGFETRLVLPITIRFVSDDLA